MTFSYHKYKLRLKLRRSVFLQTRLHLYLEQAASLASRATGNAAGNRPSLPAIQGLAEDRVHKAGVESPPHPRLSWRDVEVKEVRCAESAGRDVIGAAQPSSFPFRWRRLKASVAPPSKCPVLHLFSSPATSSLQLLNDCSCNNFRSLNSDPAVQFASTK